MLKARLDRHKCVGAGNCITLAPTVFDWLRGDFGKAEVLDVQSVEEDLLREAALSCPTQAIEIEDVEELLPWQLRGTTGPARRVVKTFMFTDIVGSTNLHEAARIAARAEGGEILASSDTVAGSRFSSSNPRSVELKGISEPITVATVDWQ